MMQLISIGYDDGHVREYKYWLIHSHTVYSCRHNSDDGDDDGSVDNDIKGVRLVSRWWWYDDDCHMVLTCLYTYWLNE